VPVLIETKQQCSLIHHQPEKPQSIVAARNFRPTSSNVTSGEPRQQAHPGELLKRLFFSLWQNSREGLPPDKG